MQIEAEWTGVSYLTNHLTKYFTKDMAIDQIIYHHKQFSR